MELAEAIVAETEDPQQALDCLSWPCERCTAASRPLAAKSLLADSVFFGQAALARSRCYGHHGLFLWQLKKG